MNDDIIIVLKMVEQGKISAIKAKEILETLEKSKATPPKKYEDKFLKVEVLSHEGDKVKVQLPIKVIKEALKATGKLPISTYIEAIDGIDIDELMTTLASCLDNEVMGEIVDIHSSKGDTVKIVID